MRKKRMYGTFGVIYADCPWTYEVYSTATGHGRSAESHYSTVPDDLLKTMNVAPLALQNCALLGWCTSPRLPQCIEVYESWGFEFVNVLLTWVKLRKGSKEEREVEAWKNWKASDPSSWHMGMGYYTRQNPEFLCLFKFKNGHPKILRHDVRAVLPYPVQAHSEKPPLHELIRTMFDGPYLELFARRNELGWSAWGDSPNLSVPVGVDLTLGYSPDEPLLAQLREQKRAERGVL